MSPDTTKCPQVGEEMAWNYSLLKTTDLKEDTVIMDWAR